MKRHCLALDLHDDAKLIAAYEEHHKSVWPEIIASIKDSGILSMEIFRTGNRLFMVMETENDFSFEKKEAADYLNKKVQAWEELMWKYQKPLPWAAPGQKWIVMEKVFSM